MNIVEAQQPNSTDMEQMQLKTLNMCVCVCACERERILEEKWKQWRNNKIKRTVSCSLSLTLCCLLPALFCQLIQTVLNLRICFRGRENGILNWDTHSDTTNTQFSSKWGKVKIIFIAKSRGNVVNSADMRQIKLHLMDAIGRGRRFIFYFKRLDVAQTYIYTQHQPYVKPWKLYI